jgi:hypothetical protein
MAFQFFSEAWCDEALKAERAAAPDIYKRFKKPAEFTHVLALEVADRPDLITHVEYVEGRSTVWTTRLFDEDRIWARFTANLEAWRTAAEGGAKASNLVMAGRMKLTKGGMKDALENAAPFDRLVQCFGAVPTAWDV